MYPTSHGTLHCQVSDLQQGGSSDHELQKQRASHWKQPAASVSNLSCLWRERTLRKPVPKSKQQCPRKSILAEGQERSPRPEHSHSTQDTVSDVHQSRFYLDDEYVDMIRNKFLQYTRLAIPEFRDTLIQHMESVKKSIGERAQHKMQYDRRVNERQIQTTEEKTDTSNALDASSVILESNGTESKEQDTSSRSGNDAHVDDAHSGATPEFNNVGKADQSAD
ncbi:hypothetical protein Tco_0970003 [Tanacetum coccineum]